MTATQQYTNASTAHLENYLYNTSEDGRKHQNHFKQKDLSLIFNPSKMYTSSNDISFI
jgi:hypothetical protein